MHSGRESIVGRLTHVDVIVWVNRFLATQLTSEDLDGTVRNDLVDVHVGLGTRTGLEDDEGEVGVEFAGDDFIGGLADGIGDFGVEAVRLVDGSSGFFENTESFNERFGHAFLRSTDVEVLKGSLSLSAPVAVGGDLEGTESVLLGTELGLLGHDEGGRSKGSSSGGDGGGEGDGETRSGNPGRCLSVKKAGKE